MTEHDHDPPAAPIAPRARLDRRRFLQGLGATATAGAVAAAVPAGRAAALPAGASQFMPLPAAVRVIDTRDPSRYTFTSLGDRWVQVPIAGSYGVPAGASAIVGTITAVNRAEPNFVTVFPSGTPVPEVSNLNMVEPGAVNANLATVRAGAGGALEIYCRVPCDVIFDVLGYYRPVTGVVREGRFVGLPFARRAIDTRPGFVGSGEVLEVDVTAHTDAQASSVVINLTATECTGPGYFTAFAATEVSPPSASSLNVVREGETRAAAVIVPVSTVAGRRRIKVFALTAAKLIVDVTGYFTGPGSPASDQGLFVPVDPVRILDTRRGQGRLWPSWVVEAPVPGAAAVGASAVVLNVTGVDSLGPGYLTVSAARNPIPETSNVNFAAPGAVVPNHVVTAITAGYGLQVFSSHGAHVLADYAGYFTGTPSAPTLGRYVNPPPPPIAPPWLLHVPRLGLSSWVNPGDPVRVTNHGDTWHWTGTGYMGEQANVAAFAHRTEAGGPFRYLHLLDGGDVFSLSTLDGRVYTYSVVRRDLTDADTGNILGATRLVAPPSFSLVACTVGYDSSKPAYPDVWAPTSLLYRIVVTGVLTGWRDEG